MPVSDPTTNYGWALPDVDGDIGAWGAMLRSLLGAAAADPTPGIDAVLKAVSDVADAAMPYAGGTFTGNIRVQRDTYDVVDAGNLSGTVTFDLDSGRFFYGTVTGAITSLSFPNTPATGQLVFVMLELTNGGSAAITWPASINWPGGSAPVLTTSGVDVLSFYTRDGGATWRGSLNHEDSS